MNESRITFIPDCRHRTRFPIEDLPKDIQSLMLEMVQEGDFDIVEKEYDVNILSHDESDFNKIRGRGVHRLWLYEPNTRAVERVISLTRSDVVLMSSLGVSSVAILGSNPGSVINLISVLLGSSALGIYLSQIILPIVGAIIGTNKSGIRRRFSIAVEQGLGSFGSSRRGDIEVRDIIAAYKSLYILNHECTERLAVYMGLGHCKVVDWIQQTLGDLLMELQKRRHLLHELFIPDGFGSVIRLEFDDTKIFQPKDEDSDMSPAVGKWEITYSKTISELQGLMDN